MEDHGVGRGVAAIPKTAALPPTNPTPATLGLGIRGEGITKLAAAKMAALIVASVQPGVIIHFNFGNIDFLQNNGNVSTHTVIGDKEINRK